MRRLLLFAAALVLLGLSTAVAASFSVQAEDVATFTTDVSISIPDPQPTPFPNVLYVRSDGGDLIGDLALAIPPNSPVQTQVIVRSALAVEDETSASKFFAWATPAAPLEGYLLSGRVTLSIDVNGPAANRLVAGLFDCAAGAPPDSADATQCTLITSKVSEAGVGTGNGLKERVVLFGPVQAEIAPGRQLRLKIVNPAASSTDWMLSWGYLPARQSTLTVAP